MDFILFDSNVYVFEVVFVMFRDNIYYLFVVVKKKFIGVILLFDILWYEL